MSNPPDCEAVNTTLPCDLAVLLGCTEASAATMLKNAGGSLARLLDEQPGVTKPTMKRKLSTLAALGLAAGVDRAWQRAKRVTMSTPEAVAIWGRQRLGHLTHEELWTVGLNNQHQIIGAWRLASGSPVGVAVTMGQIMRPLLLANAQAVVMVHNHPSGNPEPSGADLAFTREVKEACKILNMRLLDHVIVTIGGHHSIFAEGSL